MLHFYVYDNFYRETRGCAFCEAKVVRISDAFGIRQITIFGCLRLASLTNAQIDTL